MALAYLLDPTNQYQNRAGVNNVHGYFKVYLANTDDLVVTYKDFNGTLNPEQIDIDNNGRCVIIADSSHPYRVEMYEPNGTLVFTQYPVYCIAGGGSGGITAVNVESTNGSIRVDRTDVGSQINFDLSVSEDDPQFLEWAKCEGANSPEAGTLVPIKSDGTMGVNEHGIVLKANQLYHVTARFAATKGDAQPLYDNIALSFNTFNGESSVAILETNHIVDYSLGLTQEFEVSADIKVGGVNVTLFFAYSGKDSDQGEVRFLSADIHKLFSGISQAAGPITQEQSDWTEANPAAPSYIKNKPNLATVATSGSYNDLSNKPSIPAAQVNSDWNASSGVAEILNKPNLATVATSGSYDDLSNKPDIRNVPVVAAGDSGKILQASYSGGAGSYSWQEAPPAIFTAVYGTTTYAEIEAAVTAGKLVNLVQASSNMKVCAVLASLRYIGTSDAQAVFVCPPVTFNSGAIGGVCYTCKGNAWTTQGFSQVQADWTETTSWALSFIKNKPNLATVATSGSYNDLSDKPTIPSVPVQDVQVDGSSVVNAQGVAEITTPTFTQAQADWDQTNTSAADYIKNKPNLATVATSGNYSDLSGRPGLATVATSGLYSDLIGKPTIPDAQQPSDWDASTGVTRILNKPTFANVAYSGAYADLSGKPTMPTVDQTYSSSSTNAQSGTAVAEAIANSKELPDITNKANLFLQVNSTGTGIQWAGTPKPSFQRFNGTTSSVTIPAGDYASSTVAATLAQTISAGDVFVGDMVLQLADFTGSGGTDTITLGYKAGTTYGNYEFRRLGGENTYVIPVNIDNQYGSSPMSIGLTISGTVFASTTFTISLNGLLITT